MYSKFDYKPGKYFNDNIKNRYSGHILDSYKSTQDQTYNFLKNFILDNGSIDGTALKNHWFKGQKVDVFLSHSHKDIDAVKAFASWLYENFRLTSFIDSCVWNYCDDLLKIIDNEYCLFKDSEIYNYNLRNYSTSHVHAMLSSALSEMIDKTECIIFFDTPNSLVLREEIDKVKNEEGNTNSPWIYHELSMTNLIGITPPSRHRMIKEATEDFGSIHLNYVRDQTPDFDYNVSELLKKMIPLNDKILSDWIDIHDPQQSGEYALDELYAICAPKLLK